MNRKTRLAVIVTIAFCVAPLCSPAAAVPHDADSGGWPSYNGSYAGSRYSVLSQITADNAEHLKEICRVRAGEIGSFHSGPVFANGLVYITTAHITTAVNPTNCEIAWRTVYASEQTEPWPTNHGVGFADRRVFRGTGDGRLLAFDAATGKELWRTVAADPGVGEWIGSAPIVWNGVVFAGLSGGDWGIKGRMLAFDAGDGHKLWQFNLIPQDGEPNADTWSAKSNLRGGGGSWTSYALDPETGELFVSVGNPSPAYDKSQRRGRNLYTNSVVVLDANSGALRWWYQLRPADDHDLDLAAPPMLMTTRSGRKLLLLGSKDGWVYAIDRLSHKLAYKTAVSSFKNVDMTPTPAGIVTCPGMFGGVEWNGPAFDALHDSIVVGSVDWCNRLTLARDQIYQAGQVTMHGVGEMVGAADGWVTSIDAATGIVKWKYDMHAAVLSAITPTAGGVVFVGDARGNFYTFDSADGRVLSKIDTGGALAGGIITFGMDNRQYVAVASGNVSRLT
jgi:PQQ-dependent dehydrogenase (methanol/ethanol family)